MNTFFSRRHRAHHVWLAITAATLLTHCNAASVANGQIMSDASTTNSKTASAATPPQVGDVAPDFELEAISGGKVKLSATAKKESVVLVMLRGYPGYQCPICTQQVAQLISKAKEFQAAKAHVLLVYPGPSDGLRAHADEFVKGKNLPENFDLLLDPDFAFTNSYGLRWDAPGETSYPSTFVLDAARKVLFAKISHEHGDRAKVEDILAALPNKSSK